MQSRDSASATDGGERQAAWIGASPVLDRERAFAAWVAGFSY